jgi:H+-transporting ATPase
MGRHRLSLPHLPLLLRCAFLLYFPFFASSLTLSLCVGVTIVLAFVYWLLNKIPWLNNLGRKKRSVKNSMVENFLSEVQRLSIVHERSDDPSAPSVYKFSHGATDEAVESGGSAKKDDKKEKKDSKKDDKKKDNKKDEKKDASNDEKKDDSTSNEKDTSRSAADERKENKAESEEKQSKDAQTSNGAQRQQEHQSAADKAQPPQQRQQYQQAPGQPGYFST